MSIEARAKLLVEELNISQKQLEAESGISQQVWSKAFNGRQRMNSTHIEYLCKKLPEYSHWLTTGSEESGSSPASARCLDYFTRIAEKYAEAKAEYDYALTIEKYLSDTTSIIDENGIAGSSPIPSDRKYSRQNYLDQMIYKEFKVVEKKVNSHEQDDIRSVVDEYFREKAEKEFFELAKEYGNENRVTVMLGRLLTELLIPGSKSNVFNHSEIM